jgi:hypothetical protein
LAIEVELAISSIVSPGWPMALAANEPQFQIVVAIDEIRTTTC